MGTTPLQVQLDKYAASDLRLARREGEIAVGGTKVGTVFVRFEEGKYSVTTAGLQIKVLVEGAPKVVRPFLASLYVVSES